MLPSHNEHYHNAATVRCSHHSNNQFLHEAWEGISNIKSKERKNSYPTGIRTRVKAAHVNTRPCYLNLHYSQLGIQLPLCSVVSAPRTIQMPSAGDLVRTTLSGTENWGLYRHWSVPGSGAESRAHWKLHIHHSHTWEGETGLDYIFSKSRISFNISTLRINAKGYVVLEVYRTFFF